MSNSPKPLIVILGPTASGKTELGLKLAKKYNGEIINADSRQIYKEMVIGTGSPIIQTKREKQKEKSKHKKPSSDNTSMFKPFLASNVPHHLFNIIDPNREFSLAEYQKLATETIKEVQKRGRIPFLVGGTGLYISAIVDNLEIPKAPPSKKIREELEKKSKEYLFSKLKKIDPKSAKIIGPHNKRKLIRALEVCKITGKPFSEQQRKGKPLFNSLQIGIKRDTKELYKKIDERIEKMIEDGLIEEVKKLSKKYSFNLPAMSGIGYKEINLYLTGRISLEEAVQKIKFRTHQYARRQMTWFRRDKRIRWIENYKEAKKLVEEFLNAF